MTVDIVKYAVQVDSAFKDNIITTCVLFISIFLKLHACNYFPHKSA